LELSPLSRDLLSFFRVTQVWSYEHTHTYIYVYVYVHYMICIYIIMYTWKSWSMGFSYRAQPAQPGLQSSTRKCNCDHQRTPDCGHGSLTTLSWSCWLMIAFISCYIIFDDLWWSLMIFDDLWWSLMIFDCFTLSATSFYSCRYISRNVFKVQVCRVHLRSPPMLVFVPERSDFRSGDGGEHLDDCPEHRTGGVATGGTFSRWKLWNVMNMSGTLSTKIPHPN
jgi:hypothetical protein